MAFTHDIEPQHFDQLRRQLIKYEGSLGMLSKPVDSIPEYNYTPAIAAVPFYYWTIVLAFVLLCYLRYRQYLGPSGHSGAKGSSGGSSTSEDSCGSELCDKDKASGAVDDVGTGAKGGDSEAGGNDWGVQELRFTSIRCSVPNGGWKCSVTKCRQRFDQLLNCFRATLWLKHKPQSVHSDEATATPEMSSGYKVILHGVSGAVRRGEVVGLLGPSGGGKSTLLNILSSSTSDLGAGSVVSGDITLNGRPVDRKTFRQMAAFVPQEDILMPTLTVAECLHYSAVLRLPRGTKPSAIQARVGQILQELNLCEVGDSRIGDSRSSGRRGISGGERRRVSIGMELVADPAVLMFDEPTTGLDSHTALNVMLTLRKLAQRGRIVLASIHQPSPTTFSIMDRVFLLASGRFIFSGTPVEAEEAFSQFEGMPLFGQRIPIAEHMLICASNAESAQKLLQSYVSSSDQEETSKEDIESGNTLDTRQPSSKALFVTSTSGEPVLGAEGRTKVLPQGRPSFRLQVLIIFRRTLLDIFRNPMLLLLHMVLSVLVGTALGFVYMNTGNTQMDVTNIFGAIFFSLVMFAGLALSTTDVMISERHLVSREIQAKYYSASAYFLAKTTIDHLLLRAIPALLYCTLLYPIMGLRAQAHAAALFFLLLAVFSALSSSMSMMYIFLCGTASQAFVLTTLTILLSAVFSGFLASISRMPDALAWLHYLSMLYWPFTALATTQIMGQTYDIVFGSFKVKEVNPWAILSIFDMQDNKEVLCTTIAAVAFYFGLLLLAYLALIIRTKIKPMFKQLA